MSPDDGGAHPPSPTEDAGNVNAPSALELAKRRAAYTAVDRHVQAQHRIIGIGSGSTVPYVVERIVQQGPEINKGRIFIPTGFQSKELIIAANLVLGDLDQHPEIDVAIDGADEVDASLNLVKGGGACQLREKVLAEAATTFIVVADHRKNVDLLGTNFVQGIPIEVVPFAHARVLHNLRHSLASPKAALRMAIRKAGPVVSDNGNFIIDAPYERHQTHHPEQLLQNIKMLTGIVEVGLFCGMTDAAYFGNPDGSVTARWRNGKVEHISVEK